MLLYVIMMIVVFTSFASSFDPSTVPSDPISFESIRPDFGIMKGFLIFYPLIISLVVGILYGWMWSVGNGLQNKMPEGVVMKVNKFRMALLYPLFYLLILCLGLAAFFLYGGSIISVVTSAISLILFLIFHLLAMFCMLYSMYFVAKTIKTVELQRPVTFGDFAGEFFLIWFFFIGVWILQPKVNTFAQYDWPVKEFV